MHHTLFVLLLAAAPVDPACLAQPSTMPVAGRASPFDSIRTDLAGGVVKICYGRPSIKGRKIFGDAIAPYNQLWRTGANEPTHILTTVPITVGGIALAPGSYSLYTVPQAGKSWKIVLNKSTSQWGHEARYPGVQSQEIARADVPAEALTAPVEMFTMRFDGTGASRALILEWEKTRVTVPVAAAR